MTPRADVCTRGHRHAGVTFARPDGRHFGGGAPSPPPPPPPPTRDEAGPDAQAQAAAYRARLRQRRGRAATMLTGGGVTDNSGVQTSTLLGGGG